MERECVCLECYCAQNGRFCETKHSGRHAAKTSALCSQCYHGRCEARQKKRFSLRSAYPKSLVERCDTLCREGWAGFTGYVRYSRDVGGKTRKRRQCLSVFCRYIDSGLASASIEEILSECGDGPFCVTELSPLNGEHLARNPMRKEAIIAMTKEVDKYLMIRLTRKAEILKVVARSVDEELREQLEMTEAIKRGNPIDIIVTTRMEKVEMYHASPHAHKDMNDLGSFLVLLQGRKNFAVHEADTDISSTASLFNRPDATAFFLFAGTGVYFRPNFSHQVYTHGVSVALSIPCANLIEVL